MSKTDEQLENVNYTLEAIGCFVFLIMGMIAVSMTMAWYWLFMR